MLCGMKHNLRGRTFGTLTVLEFDIKSSPERTRWVCRCACGEVKSVMTQNLLKGDVQSCGRGMCHPNAKHGGRINRDPEYSAWCSIKQRCYSPTCPNFARWGGRGIKMCDQWLNNYEQFLADVGRKPSPDHTLDRRNNDGNYEPGNVRWVTATVQQNNKRTNRIVEFNGRKQSVGMWATEMGVHRNLILRRLNKGWSVQRAITEKPRTAR